MDQENQTVETNEQDVVETQVKEQEQPRTFTQEEVDEIVSLRLERQKQSLRKDLRAELQSEFKQEQSEARKLNRMNEEQRREYEYKKKDEELQALRAQVNRNEMEHTATNILNLKGIAVNTDILDFVVADTAEQTQANIDKFVDLVDTTARANRRKEFTDPVPKDGNKAGKEIGVDEFNKMSYQQRVELKEQQPELYTNLIQKIIQ